jgi:hypothetical protein
MCQKRIVSSLYLLIQKPLNGSAPYVYGAVKNTPLYNQLYNNYLKDPESLSKRDIEGWGFLPPVGANIIVAPWEVDPFWLLRRQ